MTKTLQAAAQALYSACCNYGSQREQDIRDAAKLYEAALSAPPYHYTSQLRSMAGGLRMQDNDYAKIAADNLELYAAAFEFFLAAPKPDTPEQATPDQVIDLACALEQRRALHIVAEVAALQIGGADSQTPTPFQAGYALACEEIETRLRTQQWVLGDVPAPLPPPAGSAA